MSTVEGTAGTEATKPAEPKAPKRGIGTVANEAIRAGKTNEEALAAVKAEFPQANASLASINWYRNKLRTDGETTVPTARELAAKAKADAPKAEKAPKPVKEKAAKVKGKKTTTTSAEAVAQADAAAKPAETPAAVDPLA